MASLVILVIKVRSVSPTSFFLISYVAFLGLGLSFLPLTAAVDQLSSSFRRPARLVTPWVAVSREHETGSRMNPHHVSARKGDLER